MQEVRPPRTKEMVLVGCGNMRPTTMHIIWILDCPVSSVSSLLKTSMDGAQSDEPLDMNAASRAKRLFVSIEPLPDRRIYRIDQRGIESYDECVFLADALLISFAHISTCSQRHFFFMKSLHRSAVKLRDSKAKFSNLNSCFAPESP